MINDHKRVWSCVGCQQNCNTIHEIFYGSSKRKKSIKYNLQSPLCGGCHRAAHGIKSGGNILAFRSKNQEQIKELLCQFLGVDYYKATYEINQKSSYYLNSIKDECKNKINKLEV